MRSPTLSVATGVIVMASVVVFAHAWMALVGVGLLHGLAAVRRAWLRIDDGVGGGRLWAEAQFAGSLATGVVLAAPILARI